MGLTTSSVFSSVACMSEPLQKKQKSARRISAQEANQKNPCPVNSCKHPPIDHRPVAHSKAHFCYGAGCMSTCGPVPARQRVNVG